MTKLTDVWILRFDHGTAPVVYEDLAAVLHDISLETEHACLGEPIKATITRCRKVSVEVQA